ncbi:MAG: VPLPA-CTERM sorting domain-containing protein [Gammaproteobacteria bacterium]|nr:VPLPA-CTERM sorting domain-containing protein [Gammaproteobacteria bacterium]
MRSIKVIAPLRAFSVAAVLLAGAPLSQAASIGLAPSYPDLTTSSAALSYTYTAVCQNSSGSQIGTCDGSRTIARWDLSYGRLTITRDGSQILNPDGTGIVPVSNTAGLNYDLTVILGFAAGGTALSGILLNDPYSGDALYTSNLVATGLTPDPGFQSGTIVSGTPTSAIPYGFSGVFGHSGTDAAGTFEFKFNNVAGDMAVFGDNGGVIASTFNLSHALLPGGGGATWDSKGVNFWKNNFSATVNVDTFVPVPAAAWLFGTALACMGWLRRRSTSIAAAS